MNLDIAAQELARFSAFIDEKLGLYFPPQRRQDLRRAAAAAARELGFDDLSKCLQHLMSAPLTREQSEILAAHLTVGETYFFRERKTFDTLAERVLPALIQSRRDARRLRIWSAGCCTGEEAYSLAILLRQTIPDVDDWNVTILGTDLNPRFLRKAATGVYGNWSFRDTPAWIQDRYFKKTPSGNFKISPEIGRMVTFAPLNLAEDTYPSLINDTNAMDLIFCRNVLMYFSPRQARKVIEKLYRAQVENGWLVVSPSESSNVLLHPYVNVDFPGVVLYRKDSRAQRDCAPSFPPANTAPVIAPAAPPIHGEPPPTVTVEPVAPAVSPYEEALALYERGDYAQAVHRLQSLATGPGVRAEVCNLLVRALANQGKLDEALGWSDRGIAIDKLNPASHYLRAVVLQEQGALEDAAAALRRALYIDPDFVLAHFALGSLARHAGKVRESDRHLKNALESLRGYRREDLVSESEGISAGRLSEIITSLMETRT